MSSKSAKNKPGKVSKADAAAAAKKRRNIIIASVVAVAVAAAAIVIVAGSGGSDSKSTSTGSLAGTSETKALLDGIPQNGNTLGNPKAPLTMIEYADLQCPFCKQFALSTYPEIVNKYVRTGKLLYQFDTLTFIGPDSEKAARAAAAAGVQNREANFSNLWYFNQGQENSGYATDGFIDKIYDAAGVDKAKANLYRRSEQSKAPLEAAQAGAEKYGVVSTPSFVLGKTGGPYQKIEVDIASLDGFTAAIDAQSKK